MPLSQRNRSVPSRARRALAAVSAAAVAAVAVFVGAPPASAATSEGLWNELESGLTSLIEEAGDAGFRMGVSVEDLTGAYGNAVLTLGDQEQYKAASVIKLPLLALLMSYADAGTLSLDEVVTIPAGSSNIVGGAGTLQTRSFPLDITVGELMQLMVQVSDNTATNVLVDRAGGFAAIDDYIASLGYDTMWFGRKMIHAATPPLGENWLNSAEVTDLIARLYRHEILSPASSEHIIDLMKGQLVNTKFGAVIPREHLANKTGELGDASHDSGIIFLDGNDVALTVTTGFASGGLTAANGYVQRAATLVYQMMQQPIDAPIPPPTIGISDAWPELTSRIQPIIDEASAAGIDIGVAVEDLSGSYDGKTAYLGKLDRFTTASTIKMALAATVMHQVQSGVLSLDDVYTLTPDERYGGTGVLKDNPFPQDVTVGRMLDLMITVSDNTATNKLVDVVGGFDPINELTESAGIGRGDLHFGRKMFGPIVPVYGDIWLTPYGVNQLMALFYDIAEGAVEKPDFLTAESARTLIDLMLAQQVNTKLGAVIPQGVLAHKTGENDSVSHDIGLLLVPGQELSLSVFSTRQAVFAGDVQATANPFLQRIGTAVYDYVLATAPSTEPGGGSLPESGGSDGGDDGHHVPAAPAATDRELAASGGDVAPLLLTAGAAGLILAAGVALVAIRSHRRWSDI